MGRRTNTTPIDIVGSNEFDRYKKQSIQATYNMIISDGALVPYAGYEKRLQLQTGITEGREIFRSVKANKLIVVIGNVVYSIGTDLGVAIIGQLATSSGNVFIAENDGDQIAIVDALTIYIYNIRTHAFNAISVDFRPVYIDFQDGYFIAADGDSNQWRLSDLNNGLLWPNTANTVGELETKPDIMVATVRFDRQLFIMGRITTEIWHDVGARVFPYERDNSVSIDYGCVNATTIASGFGLLVWLAVNEKAGPTILVSTGSHPRQISTDGINFILDKLEKPEDSTAFLFEEDGHIFYQLTFFTDDITLTYDFRTEKFYYITDHCLNAHIARRIAFFANTHYFIGTNDGALYELSSDFVTYKQTLDPKEPGFVIPRIRITKPFRLPNASRYAMNEVNVTTEMGNAFLPRSVRLEPNGVAEIPQLAELSMSKDGGETFGTVVTRPFNEIGRRANRLRWFNLGSGNDTVFQFRFYGPFRFVIINSTLGWWQ